MRGSSEAGGRQTIGNHPESKRDDGFKPAIERPVMLSVVKENPDVEAQKAFMAEIEDGDSDDLVVVESLLG